MDARDIGGALKKSCGAEARVRQAAGDGRWGDTSMYKRTRGARRKEMESVCDALCGVWFRDEGWCKEALRGRVRQRSKLMAFFIGWSKKREKGGASL
jgi:hypothetical protein